MTHLVRGGGLLAALIVAIVLLRGEFTPPSFGVYGFYRADAVQEWANRPISFAPRTSCQSCHQNKTTTLSQSSHSTVSCQVCHGPAQAHIERGADPILDTSKNLCASCHEKLISRPSWQPQVDLAEHGGQQRCTSCHNPHAPRLGGPPKIPHALEGRSDCLLCHGPGAVKPFPLNHAGRTSDVCLSCHQSGQATSGGSAQNPTPSAALPGSPGSGALTAAETGRQAAQIPQAR